jgi:fumarylacetoacetase
MATKSWFPIPPRSHFSLANIPFGIISTRTDPTRRAAIAIGDHVLDLKVFSAKQGFADVPSFPAGLVFAQPTLNSFAALGRPVHREVRIHIQKIFSASTPFPHLLKDNAELQKEALIHQKDVTMHLPMSIGDYTDFYAGLNHAFMVGTLFRGAANALQKNYKHIPVGYHGRASSVVVSGTPIRRPQGQLLLDPVNQPDKPTFTACRRLDIELEIGAFVSRRNKMGEPILMAEAEDHIFGLVLMNDWSARDIQAWEYVPLGPFNGKNFGTTISPWVVLLDALEPYRTKGLENDTEILPYLKEGKERNVYDIRLQVDLESMTYPAQ